MSDFERTVLAYFRDEVGMGVIQRIDGIECFSPLPKFWFWRSRLNRMVRKGLLKRRGIGSIWPSCDGMPGYGLASPAPETTERPE
jgi:hypothetical protein